MTSLQMSYKFPGADEYLSPGLALASADVISVAPATGGWGAGRHPSTVGEPATVRVVYVPMLPDELLDDFQHQTHSRPKLAVGSLIHLCFPVSY